jgi:hypothetical protein
VNCDQIIDKNNDDGVTLMEIGYSFLFMDVILLYCNYSVKSPVLKGQKVLLKIGWSR